ncbi:hypothetical protein QVD17_28841 [Tagetes erecta]|uniref:Uncharacterized protein n=1 Tax=Tagetes erecta TaxID=13708 RepID=A0AAD8KEH0_TARER|nr:hypothetical protein QVD17_28841 [Tagetes erecta]
MATNHPSNLDDESEETVSLCDLPIYGYEIQHTTTSSESSMKEEENFEFYTQEWLKNNQDLNLFPNKGIIFGGNLILPKKPISRTTKDTKKNDLASTQHDLDSCSSPKHESFKFISMHKHDHASTKRLLIPASASMKSRWYYYGFGLAGIPTEMELSGIRNRQNRHRKRHPIGAQGGGPKEEGGGLRQGKGLGTLIRDMICDGHTQANSMVKASLVYIPRV